MENYIKTKKVIKNAPEHSLPSIMKKQFFRGETIRRPILCRMMKTREQYEPALGINNTSLNLMN